MSFKLLFICPESSGKMRMDVIFLTIHSMSSWLSLSEIPNRISKPD